MQGSAYPANIQQRAQSEEFTGKSKYKSSSPLTAWMTDETMQSAESLDADGSLESDSGAASGMQFFSRGFPRRNFRPVTSSRTDSDGSSGPLRPTAPRERRRPAPPTFPKSMSADGYNSNSAAAQVTEDKLSGVETPDERFGFRMMRHNAHQHDEADQSIDESMMSVGSSSGYVGSAGPDGLAPVPPRKPFLPPQVPKAFSDGAAFHHRRRFGSKKMPTSYESEPATIEGMLGVRAEGEVEQRKPSKKTDRLRSVIAQSRHREFRECHQVHEDLSEVMETLDSAVAVDELSEDSCSSDSESEPDSESKPCFDGAAFESVPEEEPDNESSRCFNGTAFESAPEDPASPKPGPSRKAERLRDAVVKGRVKELKEVSKACEDLTELMDGNWVAEEQEQDAEAESEDSDAESLSSESSVELQANVPVFLAVGDEPRTCSTLPKSSSMLRKR
eukprot:gb/GFBE01077555.1/.p1 GENE.gb/GFBE01077555.1/~~gb/GFBE01077555.1/.p1  ORF type:complete len:447 (+),score=82.25 gb/GFBE01077555.1/:1-1341(+)